MDPITALFLGIVHLVIFVITVISIARNQNHGFGGKFLWFLIALFFPILGAILWLLIGRGKKR